MTSPALSLNAALETPASPFPGLRPFKETESHLFFGRDEQIEKVVVKLAEKRFLAVVGTSGSGKSSLVRAGLISALRSGTMAGAGHKWRIAEFRPTNDPIGNLARALNSAAVFGAEENAAIQNAITEATLRLGSRGLIEAVRQNPLAEDESLLVLVDQFEELFRFAREARKTKDNRFDNDAAAFVKLLLEAVKPTPDGRREANIYVVLTMRSDFLGDCSQFWELPEAVTESQYLIPRLTRDQLCQVIEGPVAIGGGEIAPRLVNQLLNDITDNQDQLPILQHALMRTWDRWIAGSRRPVTDGTDSGTETNPQSAIHNPQWIDLEHYEATGGMANALSEHADEAYEELPVARHRFIAKRMFKALTEKGEDNREIRRSVEFGKLCAITEATVSELKTVIEIFREPGRSFLMPPAGTVLEETTLVDISHESLIRVWEQLQRWVDEEAESAAIYLRLADAACRNAELWRGKDLQEAEDWLAKNPLNEVWAERYDVRFTAAMFFLQDSQRQREIEKTVAEHQRRKKIEQAERELAQAKDLAEAQRQNAEVQQQRAEEQARSASRLQRVIAGLIIVGLLAGVAASIAFKQYQSAESNLIQSRNLLYVANQLLAWTAFDQKRSDRIQDSLEASFPSPGADKNEDLRSFDWYYLWRQMHDEEQTLKGHTWAVNSVAYSPDGRTLASGSWDKTVRLWDVGSGKELRRLEGHVDAVSSVVFSPDGRTLASGSWDKTVRLWDVHSGKELRRLEGHTGRVLSVVYSPNGQMLASGSADKTLRLWNMDSGQELHKLEGHLDIILSAAYSPNGQMLASGSADKTLRFWDVGSGQELRKLEGHTLFVSSLVFSPDGRTLASSSADKTVRLWDIGSGKQLRKLEEHTDVVRTVAFSPDGRMLASGSEDKTLRLWDVGSGKQLRKLEGHAGEIYSIAFSPYGKKLASGSWDETVKLWEIGSGKELPKLEGQPISINSVVFSPNGQMLASGSDDKTLRLWDVVSGKQLQKLEGHTSAVWSVAFSPNGQMLASGSDDKTLRLWDVGNGQALRKLEKHMSAVWSVAFSPNGQMLASGSDDNTLRLWDVFSSKQLQKLEGHTSAVNAVAFSPDGWTLASGSSDGTVRLWDVSSGKQLRKLEGPASGVLSVAFSPDGRTLASGSSDKTVRLWDVSSGKQLRKLAGHENFVRSVVFSPDGRTLASGSSDKAVRLWDVASGKELRKLAGHAGSVLSVAFSQDGRILVSSSSGLMVKNGKLTSFGEILLWRGATDEEVARQCNRCGRKE